VNQAHWPKGRGSKISGVVGDRQRLAAGGAFPLLHIDNLIVGGFSSDSENVGFRFPAHIIVDFGCEVVLATGNRRHILFQHFSIFLLNLEIGRLCNGSTLTFYSIYVNLFVNYGK